MQRMKKWSWKKSIVAAHVSVALQRNPDELMTLDTTRAVTCDVLREANSFLSSLPDLPPGFQRRWGRPGSPCTSHETVFLSETNCGSVASHFARRDTMVLDDDGVMPGISWPSHDQFIHMVARRVALASAGRWSGRRYYGVNTMDSRHTGYHWISVVIEILPRDPASPVPVAPSIQLPLGVQQQGGSALLSRRVSSYNR